MILLPHRRRTMRPKKPETTRSGDLFRARLDQIINLRHELAQLAGQIDWDFIALPDNPYDGHTLRAVIDQTENHRLRDRAGLCRQGIPRPRCAKSAPRLHLGPEARR